MDPVERIETAVGEVVHVDPDVAVIRQAVRATPVEPEWTKPLYQHVGVGIERRRGLNFCLRDPLGVLPQAVRVVAMRRIPRMKKGRRAIMASFPQG